MFGIGKAGAYRPRHSILTYFKPFNKFWGTRRTAKRLQEISDRYRAVL